MGNFIRRFIAVILLLLVGSQAIAQQDLKRHNFLIIVADDLGYSDLGSFGGEIDTPNLDALAKSGIRLTGFHTTPACAPTRASLLTGSDSHRVGLGNMPEAMQANQVGQPGYEGYLRADSVTLAERLYTSGYRTMFSGKWHLGVQPNQDPSVRGFQKSFSLLHCCHNHFGRGISADPTKMSGYRENGKPVTQLPSDFYSSRYFATKLIEQITTSKAGPDGGKPFFAYLAFSAPHAPLQAPPETIAKYHGRYDSGFEKLRARRLQRQRDLGLLDPSVQPHPMIEVSSWTSLSENQKRVSARKMEIYAAMIDELDQAVGRVITALQESGEFENTVVIFLSDNGAEAREESPAYASSIDDLHTMGSSQGYINYGRGWAQAVTAPFWRFKTFATEGGTHTPAFISGPIVKRPGSIANIYTDVTDIAPTILDIANVSVQPGIFEGRKSQVIDGLSWVPFLNDGKSVYPSSKAVGLELFGSRSLRKGDWKITDIGDGKWKLFNIATDPGEIHDQSDKEPARKADLIAAWNTYADDVKVVLPDPPLHPNPPKQKL